jgi:hypothetical protein
VESNPAERRSSWRPAIEDTSREWRVPATGEDIDAALVVAERLLARGLDDLRHAQSIGFAALSLLLVTVMAMAGILIAVVESANVGVALAIGVLVAFGVITSSYLLRLAVQARRDAESVSLHIAVDLSAMIGEVLIDVSQREGWSHVRTESTKLRLSAFPLGQRVGLAVRDVPPIPERDTA